MHPKYNQAMTLLEVMISMTVIAVVMAMAMTGGVDLYKKYIMEKGYRNMHADVRRSLALINRDARFATVVTNGPGGVPFSATNLCLFIQGTNQTTPSVSRNRVVQYALTPVFYIDRTNNMLVRKEWWGTSAGVVNLASNPVSTIQLTLSNHSVRTKDEFFSLYKKPGQPCIASDFPLAAEVRCYMELENQILANITTDRIQVRVQLRNK
ncbi:MAG: prepilin-type N-terminal cleavage/methylation domain-containing protein [Verrucomicrobiae bacterium]|nr:prepilin-type N-terminal cleavage/methylation domain-containing protein [Verrucomicrobiae bacterium]